MPTKRTRRPRSRIAVNEVALFLLRDGLIKFELQKPETGIEAYDTQQKRDLWWYQLDMEDTEQERELWQQSRAFILRAWINERPGTRPKAWWRFDAPEKCRKRLGGTGDPAWLYLAHSEEYEYGLPFYFTSQSDVDLYGNPNSEFYSGRFKGKAIDPNDPPRYESQAAYLQPPAYLPRVKNGL